MFIDSLRIDFIYVKGLLLLSIIFQSRILASSKDKEMRKTFVLSDDVNLTETSNQIHDDYNNINGDNKQ